jgi:uncharacterized protein (TIGR01619 family)
MPHDWNCYLTNVNGKLASIFLDLGLRSEIPDRNRLWLLWIWVQLKSPRPDGLSDDSEFDSLIALDKRIAQALNQKCKGLLAGTITTQGRREFYFYGEDPENLESAVLETNKVFQTYQFEWGSQQHSEWRQYLDVLHPSEEQLQRMLNGNVLEVLRSEGDALTAPRDVTHWAYFKDDGDRAGFGSAVTLLGYRIDSESEDRDDEYAKGICVVRLQSVNRAELDEAVVELYRIARKFRGSYDGWECQVV